MARDGRKGDRKSSFFIIDKNEKKADKKVNDKPSVGENIADIVRGINKDDKDGNGSVNTKEGTIVSETKSELFKNINELNMGVVGNEESEKNDGSKKNVLDETKEAVLGADNKGSSEKDDGSEKDIIDETKEAVLGTDNKGSSEKDDGSEKDIIDETKEAVLGTDNKGSSEKEGSEKDSSSENNLFQSTKNDVFGAGEKDESKNNLSESNNKESVQSESGEGLYESGEKSDNQGGDKTAYKGEGGAFFNRDKHSFSVASSEEEVKEKKAAAFTGAGGAFFNADKVKTGDDKAETEDEENKKEEAFTGTGGAFFNKDKLNKNEDEPKTKKDVENVKKEAFTGTGGAFFNKDKIPPADEVKSESGEKTTENGSQRSEGEERSTKSILKEGNDDEKSDEDKHVVIDEENNRSVDIPKDSNVGGGFCPVILANPCEGSKIHDYRKDEQVVAEGAFFKKRIIFSCFWHKKYFVLLNDGTLVYHKCNGARYAKGKWNIKESTNYQKINNPNAWFHPFRFTFDVPDAGELYFSYDSSEERDYWFDTLEGVSRGN
ncbi:hypothetical protein PAEPH01_0560 [Pancytospora epiphaga]|nr:hypothetical protein PAEPH01_0560 [Pancytospora epiphaga]